VPAIKSRSPGRAEKAPSRVFVVQEQNPTINQ